MSGRIAVMATTPVETGPIGERVAANVAALRRQEGIQQRELSERLDQIGRPLSPSTLSKIEKLDRRVDVDDLVALALALGVTPNRLLLDAWDAMDEPPTEEIALAPATRTTPEVAWRWACGDAPMAPRPWERRRPPSARNQDFRENNRPHDADAHDFDRMAILRTELEPLWRATQDAANRAGVPVSTALKFLQFMQALEWFSPEDRTT